MFSPFNCSYNALPAQRLKKIIVCSLLRPGTAMNWQSTFNNYPSLLNIMSDLDGLLEVWHQICLIHMWHCEWSGPFLTREMIMVGSYKQRLSLSASTSLWRKIIGGSNAVPWSLCIWPALKCGHLDEARVPDHSLHSSGVTDKKDTEDGASVKLKRKDCPPAWSGYVPRCIQKGHCL